MNKARKYVCGAPSPREQRLRRLTTITAARLGFKAGCALPAHLRRERIRAGVDMRTLAELLGHSDVAFTMQVYGHTDDTMKAAAMERIHNIGKASKGKNTAIDGENE